MDVDGPLERSTDDLDIPLVTKSADELDPDVRLDEFFSPAFMREHTRFASFAAFCEESPWSIETPDDIGAVPRDALDRYVARTTQFESWDRMRNHAAEREIKDRLLL